MAFISAKILQPKTGTEIQSIATRNVFLSTEEYEASSIYSARENNKRVQNKINELELKRVRAIAEPSTKRRNNWSNLAGILYFASSRIKNTIFRMVIHAPKKITDTVLIFGRSTFLRLHQRF